MFRRAAPYEHWLDAVQSRGVDLSLFIFREGGGVVHHSAASRPIWLDVVSLNIFAPISVQASHLMRRPASPRQMLARFGSSRRPCSTSWTC